MTEETLVHEALAKPPGDRAAFLEAACAVLQRFEQELQALALMDHPNLAMVLDAGLTPTGQPFFVMEEEVRGDSSSLLGFAAKVAPSGACGE
jgi:hypothetical protein